MNKDKEVILGYLKWLANRLSASMATQLNGADVDEYLEQQVNSVDLADVGYSEHHEQAALIGVCESCGDDDAFHDDVINK